MWTEESRKMWGCAQNCPQASPNSNWRKNCLQSLPWTIRPWIHTNRSQDYWFHRLLIIAIKQSLCDTYLIFNIWTHIFKRTSNFHLKRLIKTSIGVGNYILTTKYVHSRKAPHRMQSGLWRNDNNKFVHLNCPNFETEVCNTGCQVLFKKKNNEWVDAHTNCVSPFLWPWVPITKYVQIWLHSLFWKTHNPFKNITLV